MAGEGVPKVMKPKAGDLGLLERRPPRLLDADEAGLCLVIPEDVVCPQVPGEVTQGYKERVIDRRCS